MGDSEPFRTRCVLARAAARHGRPGLAVRTVIATPGKDFNDMIKGGRGMTSIENSRQERLQIIARLFEEAQPFDSLDLDDFEHIPAVDLTQIDGPPPAPQPRQHRLDAKPWSVDRAAWPYRDWLRLRRLARLDQSDTDNATRLLAHFGKDVLVRRQEGRA